MGKKVAGRLCVTGKSAGNELDFPLWAATIPIEGHAVNVTAAKWEIPADFSSHQNFV